MRQLLTTISRPCLTIACGLAGLGFLGLAGFEVLAYIRQPSISSVDFGVSLPPAMVSGGREYSLPLTVGNRNAIPVTIYGLYTC